MCFSFAFGTEMPSHACPTLVSCDCTTYILVSRYLITLKLSQVTLIYIYNYR